MPYEAVWHGAEIQLKADRALGRGLIAIGENVAAGAKEFAHVVTGTLRRSIHTAPYNYDGSEDEGTAAAGQDLQDDRVTVPSYHGTARVIEVGSWIPYACVEECGRGHLFVTPAVQNVQGARSHAIMVQAFREEGMTIEPVS